MHKERKTRRLKIKVKVSIIGATGYTGAELVKILLRHPGVEIAKITSQSFAGKKISEIYPSLRTSLTCKELNIDEISSSSSFIFTALPHRIAMGLIGSLYIKGKRIVDLSADFRLKDPLIYEKWYETAHKEKDLLKEAVYGLPELNRDKIKSARLVANPGCYSTGVILALAPLLKNNLIKEDDIIVDAKSGVSGAGRNLSLKTHFPEINENFYAYKVEGHRHIPEMEQELSILARKKVKITFIPHLIPVNRGILATCYTLLRQPKTCEDFIDIYKDFYKKEPFVEILNKGQFPQIKEVTNSNRCRIGLMVDKEKRRLLIISALDNLVKGAAGQAVQNMNIMCGFDEKMGLEGE